MDYLEQNANTRVDARSDAGLQAPADDYETAADGHPVDDDISATAGSQGIEENERHQEIEQDPRIETDQEIQEAGPILMDTQDIPNGQHGVEHENHTDDHNIAWHPYMEDVSDDDSSGRRWMLSLDAEIPSSEGEDENEVISEDDPTDWYWD